MKNKLVLRTALCAIAAALFFVFDLISIKFGPYKITMSGLPVIVIAIMFGPLDALIVGFTGAFLGQLLSYGLTPTTVLWCLPAMVRGLMIGIVARKVNLMDKKIIMIITIILSSILVTSINTLVMLLDSVIYNYYSYAYIFGALLTRFISGILTALVYSILTPLIIIPLSKI